MKRLIYILLLLGSALTASAQSEDVSIGFGPSGHSKDFGGFILDMGTMLNAESLTLPAMTLPTSLLAPWTPVTPPFLVNPDALKTNRKITFSGNVPSFLYPGTGNTPLNWQAASWRLSNGIRLSTYGEYDADGYKRYNPAALPWQKNNFNAAFEMKSPDGKFGIRLEVHQGRNYPY